MIKINLNEETIGTGFQLYDFPGKLDSDHSGLSGVFVVKGFYRLHPDADPTPWDEKAGQLCGDLPIDGDESKGLGYASDFVPYKPRADFSAIGTAYPPPNATTHFIAKMRVGDVSRSVGVVGQREWQYEWSGEKRGDPAPVKVTQLSWNNAWGGPSSPMNPLGMGTDGKKLHLLVDPNHLVTGIKDPVPPAIFAPIPPDSPVRRAKVGTYNEEWIRSRWPWMPEDFDYSYYNAPDERQWIKGYLKGDEELEFHHMHPGIPHYRARLPGLRARCFVTQTVNWSMDLKPEDARKEFHEVPLVLDTLWVDMDKEQLILVWRGHAPLRSFKFRDIDNVLVLTEPLQEEDHSLSHYQSLLEKKLEERLPKAPTGLKTAEEIEAMVQEKLKEGSTIKEKGQEEFLGVMKSQVDMVSKISPEYGARMAEVLQQAFVPRPPTNLSAQLNKFEKLIPDSLARISGLQDERLVPAGTKSQLAEYSEKMSAAAASFSQNLKDQERMMEETKEKILAGLPLLKKFSMYLPDGSPDLERIRGEGLENTELKKLDLRGADLSGVSFRGAQLRDVNLSGCLLRKANFADSRLSNTDFSGADLSEAVLDRTDFRNTLLQGALLAGTTLNSARFRGMKLAGVDFSRSKGALTDFIKADLSGANFQESDLPTALFRNSILVGADFRGAKLISARFMEAKAGRILMDDADLTGFRGNLADFSGGSFCRVQGLRSIWEESTLQGACFLQANLQESRFCEVKAGEASFDRSNLREADFSDSMLRKAALTNANLFKAALTRADLQDASLNGSNLYGSDLWGAILLHATWESANIKKTRLHS